MRNSSRFAASSLAIVTFMAALSTGASALAADTDGAMGQSMPPVQKVAKTMPGKKHMTPEQRVEMRIQNLHDKLKITTDQEDKWNAVAQVMRDNEKSIHVMIDQRHQQGQSMNAVDDLDSYQKIADEHADGLKRLIPVFKDLYNTMSDDQKKNADEVFGRFEGHRAPADAAAPVAQ